MGPTLYRLFVEDYTRKQRGTDPSLLSAEFAPKRMHLRRDGDTGDAVRHYPVPTVDGRNRRAQEALVAEVREVSPIPVFFVGRLAAYLYIDQDEAIRRAMDRSAEILRLLRA